MKDNHPSKSILNFIIPLLIAYLGSKGIFYYFSFEYSIFADAFSVQKLLIDLGVFVVLFYLGTILVKHFMNSKKKYVQ